MQELSPFAVELLPQQPAADTFPPRYRTKEISDSTAVRKAALGYIKGFYTADTTRVSQSIHPVLIKHVITKGEAEGLVLRNMGASELIFHTRNFKLPHDPSGQRFKARVRIFDISPCIATVKVTYSKWEFFDYLQLCKLQGEWKVIHVLCARTEL